MIRIIFILLVFGSCCRVTVAQEVLMVNDPVDFVNPLMGSQSKHALSSGNTYPAIGRPWGMNLWTPQTGKMGDGWIYTYDADKIVGFKQTHQPSPWMNDYGQFCIMPLTGRPVFTEEERGSWFSHKAETSTPYYYSVYLADHDVRAELTATERAAAFRFTYPQTDSAFIVIDALDSGSYVKLIPQERKIIGYTTRNKAGVPENFRNYFVITIDQDFTYRYTVRNKIIQADSLEVSAKHAGGIVGFKTSKGMKVHLKVASSFISYEQAELNLKELGVDDFETLKQTGKNEWNKQLGRLNVSGGSVDQVRTFYSCLYRTLQFPQKHYEVDGSGAIVHYSPYNGKVLPGYMFAGTGFWDTFRALYPFLNLMYPSINREMQAGLVNDYLEGGWLPEWSSPGYRNIMIGNNSASVVADAYLKGLRGYDINTLYEALLKGANNEGPMVAVGRKGVAKYNHLGYVPYEEIRESAARTLEYAYDDFTIAELGKALGRPAAETELYMKRAQNYKNLFDSSTGLMRGRMGDGSFQTPFNPFKWGDAFTEGNSWHYTWSVFHDIKGLISLMGGKKNFVNMLDSVFVMPPVYDESYYRKVIHEIREMQIMNMGQYAHGNQPIQHLPYLYNFAGAPWKTQYWVREIMDRLYKATPDGYCGDEDNGQTSAWYVFSAIGFYPVCPGTDQYVIGAPLFKRVTLQLENGRQVRINAVNNSGENRYVQSLKLNGKTYNRNWFSHATLISGSNIEFSMGSRPNEARGVAEDSVPFSMSGK